MQLKHLSDETLLKQTHHLVQREREVLVKVLHHLREIERRRLFSTLKCRSLFEYATRELGYSEDQAYRRIQAMRLLKDLPELENQLTAGTLSLTHLGMAHSLFKNEEKLSAKTFTREEKLNCFRKIENTSKREAEKILLMAASSTAFVLLPEKIRTVSENEVEIRFVANETLLQQIEILRGLLAHRSPQITLGDLFAKLCELGISKWSPAKLQSAPARLPMKHSPTDQVSSRMAPSDPLQMKPPTPSRPQSSVEASLRRQVWREAREKCENCRSLYALEIDHRVPRALGGVSTRSNLRLLCRSCNQRAAIKTLGERQMAPYLT
jgi:hypothetical protein